MNICEYVIIGLGIGGLLFWIRGCAKTSSGDCILAILLASVAIAAYFLLFSLTRTPYLAAIIFSSYILGILPFWNRSKGNFVRIFTAIAVILSSSAAAYEYKIVSAGNALLVVEPYRTGKDWAFDEPRLGLKAEPLILGIPEMLNRLSENIPGSDKSVRLIFSQNPFPKAIQLDRRHEENGGNWYYSKDYDLEGWLCPALFKFFPRAPLHIYAKAEQK